MTVALKYYDTTIEIADSPWFIAGLTDYVKEHFPEAKSLEVYQDDALVSIVHLNEETNG